MTKQKRKKAKEISLEELSDYFWTHSTNNILFASADQRFTKNLNLDFYIQFDELTTADGKDGRGTVTLEAYNSKMVIDNVVHIMFFADGCILGDVVYIESTLCRGYYICLCK